MIEHEEFNKNNKNNKDDIESNLDSYRSIERSETFIQYKDNNLFDTI